MGRPGLSTLWASGAASMYLWSRGEKELEVLCGLLAARSRIGIGVRGSLEFARLLSEDARPDCLRPARSAGRRSDSAPTGRH